MSGKKLLRFSVTLNNFYPKLPMPRDQKYSDWCFTTKHEKLSEVEALQEESKYIVIGLEEGEDGYLHYQGFVQLRVAKRLETMKGLARTTHFEPRKGTPLQASDYCKKEGIWFEMGVMTKQGDRNDIDAFVADVIDEKSDQELILTHPMCMARYPKFHDKIKQVFAKPHVAAKIIWFYGPSRTGKSGYISRHYPGAFDKSPDDRWFDGYAGQDAIVINEITAGVPYSTVLSLCDPRPPLLPTKGSFVPSKATVVFITSNDSPDRVYAHECARADRWMALLERAEFSYVERTDVAGRSVMREMQWDDGWKETGRRQEFEVYNYARNTLSMYGEQ